MRTAWVSSPGDRGYHAVRRFAEGDYHVTATGVLFLLTVLVDGALTGALYTLLALSFVVVYRASRMINFALGEWTMLASALAAAAGHSLGLGPLPSIASACVGMIGVGLGFNRLVLRPLIGQPLISLIMVTLGLAAFIRGAAGSVPRGIAGGLRLPVPTEPLLVHGLVLPADRLVAAAVAVVTVGLVTAFFRWSRTGLALRAIADDQQVAMAMGIDVQRHFALTWAVVGVLSVLAGTLWTLVIGGGVGLLLVSLKVFPIVILGGLDSIAGTIVAALVLGVLEGLAASYLDPHVGGGFSTIASYLLLIAVLFVRPYGLFGRPHVARV
jgi:branched-chain amino acid transport system permease protein